MTSLNYFKFIPMILKKIPLFVLMVTMFGICSSCGDDQVGPEPPASGTLQLVTAQIGTTSILSSNAAVPASQDIVLRFNNAIATSSTSAIQLTDQNGNVTLDFDFLDNDKIISLTPQPALAEGNNYSLTILDDLEGANGETFPGITLTFGVDKEPLEIKNITANGATLSPNGRNTEIPLIPVFELSLSHSVPVDILSEEIVLVGNRNYDFNITRIADTIYQLTPSDSLADLTKINLLFPSTIGTQVDRLFNTVSYELYTQLDPNPKFPVITDDELMTLVQERTFRYFYDFAHPVSGLARERNSSGNTVTSGGSGFGLMAIIVGVERGFITREEALTRWEKIFNFLETADRFHGAWSHWLNGNTGNVIPFSSNDNGGDLVETAFLVQGMLTVRQYLNPADARENLIISKINTLWEGVEWNWYTQGGQNVLTWHWSPNLNWQINLKIRGHNETQIVYTLAAGSPTFPIDPVVYHEGYARSGGMQNGNTFYGINLPLGSNRGGPLFFTHYSYLGMNPTNLQDAYANYWTQNVNHSLINRAYCIDNPQNYVGYSENCWGLTASDNNNGYSAHSPNNDLGVITPTAALSSIPYTPEESLAAMRHFYYQLGDRLWGEYGFYDAFNPTAGWVANSYLAIDQGPIILMIENYRTQLLWDLYMSAPEVQNGLTTLGFTF